MRSEEQIVAFGNFVKQDDKAKLMSETFLASSHSYFSLHEERDELANFIDRGPS